MRSLLFATRNRGKLAELRAMASDLPITVISLDERPDVPEVEEDRDTFAGNATKKAESAARATGLLALADDSGIEVDALGGAPGVRSARFAGNHGDDEANNRKLLASLAGVAEAARSARYVCVLALCDPERGYAVDLRDGTCEGRIGFAPRGTGGFGYDPLFVLPASGLTMAEIGPDEKNRISHRGRAMRALVDEVLRPRLRAGGR